MELFYFVLAIKKSTFLMYEWLSLNVQISRNDGAILSAIAYFIASKVIHIVEVGLSGSKTFKIITKEPKLMVETIRERLGRSATYNEVYGGYSHEKFKEITCVINRLEESKMKEIIHEIDANAFVTVYDVAEVKGGNFRKHDIH